MLVTRWQAKLTPTVDQLKLMFRLEGLAVKTESYPASSEVKQHRHPFDEVRTVVSGELKVDVSGNKLLLRAGDRIVIPSNTKHSTCAGDEECITLYAQKIY